MPARSAYQPPSQFGNYDVHTVLGTGGMATVFRGEHRLLQRPVAIKFLRSDIARSSRARQRFLREAQLVAKLSHPNIVTVFDFGELEDGTYFQASELVAGATLRELLNTTALELPVALRFARQIAVGLASAHATGVIHRDLKPSNVMVVPDPTEPDGHRLKILDFGLAKSLDLAAVDSGALTRHGVMLGTPGYMAPEQCIGSAEIGPTADIYSLGVVLYLMLCGEPPFDTSDRDQLLDRHLHELPPRPSERSAATPGIDDLVLHCLAKSPAARPQSMTEVIQRIDDALAGLDDRSRTAAPGSVPTAAAPVDAHTTLPGVGRPTPPGVAHPTLPGAAHPTPPGAAHPTPPASPAGDPHTVQIASERPLMMRLGYQSGVPGGQTSVGPSIANDTLEAASTASTVSRSRSDGGHPRWRSWLAIAAGVVGIAAGITLGLLGGRDSATTDPPPEPDRSVSVPVAAPLVVPLGSPTASTAPATAPTPGPAPPAGPAPAAGSASSPTTAQPRPSSGDPAVATNPAAAESTETPEATTSAQRTGAEAERAAPPFAGTGDKSRRKNARIDERRPADAKRAPDKPPKVDPKANPSVRPFERAVF